MLLAIDVGNTNTVLGVFDGTRLLDHWRLETERAAHLDEYGSWSARCSSGPASTADEVHAVAVSSVVPPLQFNLEKMSERYFKLAPLFVGPGVKTGHAHPLRQPARGRRRPDRQRGRRLREAPGRAHRRGLRHRHHLRRGDAQGRVPGRRDLPRHHHRHGGAVPERLQAAAGGVRAAAARGGQEHRALDAVGPGLRLRGPGGRHLRAHGSASWASRCRWSPPAGWRR